MLEQACISIWHINSDNKVKLEIMLSLWFENFVKRFVNFADFAENFKSVLALLSKLVSRMAKICASKTNSDWKCQWGENKFISGMKLFGWTFYQNSKIETPTVMSLFLTWAKKIPIYKLWAKTDWEAKVSD